MQPPLRLGLIGCGTVGSGVLELLHRRDEELAQLLGRPLEVTRIAVRDPVRPRHHLLGLVDPDIFTAEVQDVTRDPGVDLVVEVAGGVDQPREWILDALRAGKDVVTANKATLAFHGGEIFRAAASCRGNLYYEASVAGAIPIIEILQNGLVGNRVTRVSAILNGTCNYILSRMERDQMDYASALRQAQERGFAEATPSLDVSGADSAHKLALIARIITQRHVPVDQLYVEGIERIASEDVEFARQFDYRIKLLAIARRTEEGVWDMRVHPTLIPRDDMLAQVQDEFNAVSVRGDAAGPMMIYGYGAGSFPTASSVVADIVRAAKGDKPLINRGDEVVGMVPIDRVLLRHYIRLTVRAVSGALGRITSFLGMRGISIASIHQPDAKMGQPVPVVLVTHKSRDGEVTRALRELEKVGLLLKPPTVIRIED